MARKWSRRKKTSLVLAMTGLATGLGAMLLWPRIRNVFFTPRLTIGKATLKNAKPGAFIFDCPPGTSMGRTGNCLTDAQIEAEELAYMKSQGI